MGLCIGIRQEQLRDAVEYIDFQDVLHILDL